MPNVDYKKQRLPRKTVLILIILGVILISCFIWSILNGGLISSYSDKYTTSIMRASFNEKYIDESKGSIKIEVPEVYELVHIVMALTDYSTNNPYVLHKDGEYYDEVLEYFKDFKEHAAVRKMNSDLEERGYYMVKNDSFAYSLNGDEIEKQESYSTMFEIFSQQIELLEDFARVSNFKDFYKKHQGFYNDQKEELIEKVNIEKMWKWLEDNFPNRYDSYIIVFSPLVGGSHNTVRYRDKDNNYNEIIMFVSGPDGWEGMYSGAVDRGLLSCNVFTEIDHQYVNPITDQYIKEVDKCFRNLDKWNNGDGYAVSTFTFNEYMTWAAYTIFAYENYEKSDFEKIIEVQENLMVNSRGFVKYKEFNKIVFNLYLNREKGTALYDLYPEILKRVKEIK